MMIKTCTTGHPILIQTSSSLMPSRPPTHPEFMHLPFFEWENTITGFASTPDTALVAYPPTIPTPAFFGA